MQNVESTVPALFKHFQEQFSLPPVDPKGVLNVAFFNDRTSVVSYPIGNIANGYLENQRRKTCV